MRAELTRARLRALMEEIARAAPRRADFVVHLVGGATAVWQGWRAASIDADLFAPDEAVLADVQGIKERLDLNVEFARPEHFVPPLAGSEARHVFVERVGRVSFFHYDPYAQAFAKIVRGFERDLADARAFLASGFVDGARLLALVRAVPDSAYARYPRLARAAVEEAVASFLAAS